MGSVSAQTDNYASTIIAFIQTKSKLSYDFNQNQIQNHSFVVLESCMMYFESSNTIGFGRISGFSM